MVEHISFLSKSGPSKIFMLEFLLGTQAVTFSEKNKSALEKS